MLLFIESNKITKSTRKKNPKKFDCFDCFTISDKIFSQNLKKFFRMDPEL